MRAWFDRWKGVARLLVLILGFLTLLHFLIPRLGWSMLALLGIWIAGLVGFWKRKNYPSA